MTRLCMIFDIDGTLCDTNAVDDDCYREAAAVALDVAPAQIDWTDAPHMTDPGIARWLWNRLRARPPTPDEITRLQLAFLQRLKAQLVGHAQRFRAVRGAPALLENLRAAGVVLGIGTGGWRVSAELKLGTAGLPADLLYATADDAEARVDIFSLACTRANGGSSTSATTVLIGDRTWDVATARELGWRFLGVGTGAAAAALRNAGAAIVVPDYADLDVRETIQRARVPVGVATI